MPYPRATPRIREVGLGADHTAARLRRHKKKGDAARKGSPVTASTVCDVHFWHNRPSVQGSQPVRTQPERQLHADAPSAVAP